MSYKADVFKLARNYNGCDFKTYANFELLIENTKAAEASQVSTMKQSIKSEKQSLKTEKEFLENE